MLTSFVNKILLQDAREFIAGLPPAPLFDVIVADPPYNIGKDFGAGGADNREWSEYLSWCDDWINGCLQRLQPHGVLYVYGFSEILARVAARFPVDQQRWLIWHYTNKTVPSSRFWQRSHEAILCLWPARRPVLRIDSMREEYTQAFLKNSAGKARPETFGRYSQKGRRTTYNSHPAGALPRDVLKFPALAGGAGAVERFYYCKTCGGLQPPRQFKNCQNHAVIRHPTQKPQALSQKLIASCAAPGGCVYVPFAGSGAECVAAQALGVNFVGTELNPDYILLAEAWLGHAAQPPGGAGESLPT